MRYKRNPAICLCESNCVDRFRKSTNLIWFDEHRVYRFLFGSLVDTRCVCDGEIVSYDSNGIAERLMQTSKAVPVVFGKTIFDRHEGIRGSK